MAGEHGGNAVALHILHRSAELIFDLASAIQQREVLAVQLASVLAFGQHALHELLCLVFGNVQTHRFQGNGLVVSWGRSP